MLRLCSLRRCLLTSPSLSYIHKRVQRARRVVTGGDGKLNFRQAERHIPGMFNGKATEYSECTFKMEAHVSTLDPGGKVVKILRAARQKPKTWTMTR